MKFIFSSKCLEYGATGHPESPHRVARIYNFLHSKGFDFIEPSSCTKADILLAHTQDLLSKVILGNFFDPDTPSLPNIYEYAKLSVGGALKAMQLSLTGDIGFSIMRPPGHHAGKNFLCGFCYFNNIAIAINHAGMRAAILDIDCHHGNGTQDIFLGNPDILYVSLHRFGHFYPGTGATSIENAKNYPLSLGIGEKEYLSTLKHALNEITKFKPSLIGVSAGFDTYKLDPIAGLGLDIESYRKVGNLIHELNLPTFYVLEGGYSEDLPRCVYEFILGIIGQE
ncbi:MAG: histone deacetylase [bacterium]|nr:histone deacetylase [bacterium]